MEQKEYRLAAIMYTDIAGFSRMMEENEAGTLETLRRHNQLITDSVLKHGGRVIKSVGDVFLSEFPNTVDAVRSAVEVQNDIAEHNGADPVMPLYLRVGIHLGDIYFFDDDALGEGVSIANRLQSLARPGKICISQDVLNLVSTKLDLNVRSLGRSKLKNISRALAYEKFSIFNIFGGLVQAGVFAALLYAVLSNSAALGLLWAIALQLMALTFFIMGRQ